MQHAASFNSSLAISPMCHYSLFRSGGQSELQTKEIQGRSLRYLVVEPDGYSPDTRFPVVMLMHGYGASMADLASLSPAISRDGYVFIYPNGPIEVQIGPGMSGYSWIPRDSSDSQNDWDRTDRMIEGIIEDVIQVYKVAPGDMVLGGFSQGGMMTYRVGLLKPDIFAGLIILSGKVSEPEAIRQNLQKCSSQAIFVAHGTSDTMISVRNARESLEFLESEGYEPEYHEYPMGHEITQELLDDLVPWLKRVLVPGARA